MNEEGRSAERRASTQDLTRTSKRCLKGESPSLRTHSPSCTISLKSTAAAALPLPFDLPLPFIPFSCAGVPVAIPRAAESAAFSSALRLPFFEDRGLNSALSSSSSIVAREEGLKVTDLAVESSESALD